MSAEPTRAAISLGLTNRLWKTTSRSTPSSLARELGVEREVVFHNRFVSPREMAALVGSADIYITPYCHEAQAVSGTLAYAMGAGKAIISTPYWHAAELLGDGRGTL